MLIYRIRSLEKHSLLISAVNQVGKFAFRAPDFFANFMLNQICATPKFNKKSAKISANFHTRKRKITRNLLT